MNDRRRVAGARALAIIVVLASSACGPRQGSDGEASGDEVTRAACEDLCAHLVCERATVDEDALTDCANGCVAQRDEAADLGAACDDAYFALVDCLGALDCDAYFDALQNGACAMEGDAFAMACPGLTLYFPE